MNKSTVFILHTQIVTGKMLHTNFFSLTQVKGQGHQRLFSFSLYMPTIF